MNCETNQYRRHRIIMNAILDNESKYLKVEGHLRILRYLDEVLNLTDGRRQC